VASTCVTGARPLAASYVDSVVVTASQIGPNSLRSRPHGRAVGMHLAAINAGLKIAVTTKRRRGAERDDAAFDSDRF
jgi:hypothetical protein